MLNTGMRTLGLALAAASTIHAMQQPQDGARKRDEEVARIERLAEGQTTNGTAANPTNEFRLAVKTMVQGGFAEQVERLGSSAANALEWTLNGQQPAELASASSRFNALRYLIDCAPERAIAALQEMLQKDPARFDIFWVHAGARSRLVDHLRLRSDLRGPFRGLTERAIRTEALPIASRVTIAATALPWTDGTTAVDRFLFEDRTRWASLLGSSLRREVAQTFVLRTGQLLEEAPETSARMALSTSVEMGAQAVGHPSAKIRQQVAVLLASESFGREVDGRAVEWLMTLAQDPDQDAASTAVLAIVERADRGGAPLTVAQSRTLLRRAYELVGPDESLFSDSVGLLLQSLSALGDSPVVERAMREAVTDGPRGLPVALAIALRSQSGLSLPVKVAAKRIATDAPEMDGRSILQSMIMQLRPVPGQVGADRAIDVIVSAGLSADEGERVLDTMDNAARDASPEVRARLLRWMAETKFEDYRHIASAVGSSGPVSAPIRATCVDPDAPLRARVLAGCAILCDPGASQGDVRLAADALIELMAIGGDRVFRKLLLDDLRGNARELARTARFDEAVIDVFDRYPGPASDLSDLRCLVSPGRLRPEARAQAVAVAKRLAGTAREALFLDRCGAHVLAGLVETKPEEVKEIALALMQHYDDDEVMDAARQGQLDAFAIALADFSARPDFGASYKYLLKINDPVVLTQVADGALRSGNTELIQRVQSHIKAMIELKLAVKQLEELQTK